ncbi:DUF3068 domain-containing protein [Streptomyces boncukensis]|uniref:DUF3068 domain-containing protein n=1 Tax=Streptomyces boncukensis TaxID=2711219 RepID=A0A6G4WZ25_9ACTN|nr:DUF3068 domain-containing protein [Streptomyces boncukensis]NGO69681.1 DUF3068 domain-containing protein [Streptomyces boncukensis]
MRRHASPLALVLLGLGVFLLVLAPMLLWYVEPRAKRNPTDVNITSIFKGQGKYFDQENRRTRSDQKLTVTRRVLGNVADSEKTGRAVWDVSQTIDSPDTLKLDDPRRSFQWTTERWVTDRKTNLPVRCCQAKPAAGKNFSGEAYLKWPFDVEKRDYLWWDSTLGGTVPLHYKGKAKVRGYEGLRFSGTVKPTRSGSRQVPAVLVDRKKSGQIHAEQWYANAGLDFIVDERTGRILYAATGPKMTLRAPGGSKDEVTLLQSDKLAFTAKTQQDAVDLAKDDNDKLELLGTTAPLAAVVAGGVVAAAGAVLVVRGRRNGRAGRAAADGA